MHFVDGQRPGVGLMLGPFGHPLLVIPLEIRSSGHHRAGGRRLLGSQRHGVGLQRQQPVLPEDLVLVDLTRPQPGNEQLPDSGAGMQPHGVPTPVPAVEVTDHRNPPGIRRPDHETHARHAIGHPELGTEALAEAAMVALAEQVDIHVPQLRTEGVGIFGFLHATVPVDAQTVAAALVERAGEQARNGLVHTLDYLAILSQQLDLQRSWLPGTHLDDTVLPMGAEKGKGVAVFGTDQGLDIPVVSAHPVAHQGRSPSAICIDSSVLPGARPAIRAGNGPRNPLHRPPFRY